MKQFPSLQVVGGTGDGVAGATVELGTGGVVDMCPPHFRASVHQCPCHTRGHVIYKVGRFLFTGDTLFSGGCGKFFEGNASEMYKNLYHTIGTMPDDTIIFPGRQFFLRNTGHARTHACMHARTEALNLHAGWFERALKFEMLACWSPPVALLVLSLVLASLHADEYTVSNLEFAVWVEPSNEALQQRLTWARERRAGLYPTVPSTLAEEKAFNPFLRVSEPDVVASVQRAMGSKAPTGAGESLAIKVMDALRTLKNDNAHKK